VEALHKEHSERHIDIQKELQLLKDQMFKYAHELFNLRKAEADLIAEISGAQGWSIPMT
jgi:hypothetical protein